MENEETKRLIKSGNKLISLLSYFPLGDQKASSLTDNINEWANLSINQLGALGVDRDSLKILKIKNPLADLFSFSFLQLENEDTKDLFIKELTNYICLLLELLIENKQIKNKENIIYYNEESLFTNPDKIYTPIRRNNDVSKRMKLIIALIKSDKPLSIDHIVKQLKSNKSSVIKERTEINEIVIKKLKVKKPIINNKKGVGYIINKDDYIFIKK